MNPKEPQLVVVSRGPDTDVGRGADLRALGVEQEPGPTSRTLDNARAKLLS